MQAGLPWDLVISISTQLISIGIPAVPQPGSTSYNTDCLSGPAYLAHFRMEKAEEVSSLAGWGGVGQWAAAAVTH